MAKQHTSPCSGCPFNRTVKPGELGGSSVFTYIGQINGPFMLACHQSKGYFEDKRNPEHPQCAGAAIFRGHTGAYVRLPKGILCLPENRDKVFSSYAEFLAHHLGIDLKGATFMLERIPPNDLTMIEMMRSGVQMVPTKK